MKSLIFFQNVFVVIFAALINSVSISYIFGLNLVLLHGISAPIDLSVKWFYIPKLVIIFPVFIAMLFDQYFMHSSFKERFDDKMQLSSIHNNHSLNFTILLSVMTLYLSTLLYYGFMALKITGQENNEKLRFSSVSIIMTIFLTFITSFVVVLPFES